MQVWIALFRGINVSGTNIIMMAELKTLAGNLGFEDAVTYIQSGNLIFRSDKDVAAIESTLLNGVEKTFGFRPRLMLLTLSDLEAASAANPFPEAEEDPKSLHLSFMAAGAPDADLAAMVELKKDSERFTLKDNVFYMHAPEGIGRSKLAEKVEKLLGVPATGRNWRSTQKILELARAL